MKFNFANGLLVCHLNRSTAYRSVLAVDVAYNGEKQIHTLTFLPLDTARDGKHDAFEIVFQRKCMDAVIVITEKGKLENATYHYAFDCDKAEDALKTWYDGEPCEITSEVVEYLQMF